MKKFFLAILILLNSVSVSFAALASTTQWEVRTTGNANNGGGFNPSNATPGTDFSQQDAAEDSGTDLASADGDANPCVVTSATHNFVDADEGNIIKIYETGDGFTVGYYEIVSTSTNAATLDRACGTDGAKTGGDWSLGGAINHPQTIAPSVVAGNIIWIEGGTYVKVGSNTYVLKTTVNGGNGTPIIWNGYKASTSREYAKGDDRPLFDGNGDTTNGIIAGGNGNVFDSIRISGATGNGFVFNASEVGYIQAKNIKSSSNGSAGFYGYNSEIECYYCEANNNSSEGFYSGGNYRGTRGAFLYSHDNSNDGFEFSQQNGQANIFFSISDSNAGHGFNIASDFPLLINNIAYGNTGTVDGFYFSGNGNKIARIINNSSVSNGRYGFNRSSETVKKIFSDNNSYYGNGTAGLNNITAGSGDVSTDPSFTNSASADFTVGASSPLIGAGVDLSTFTSLTTDFNNNIGVDQSDHVTASSGGTHSYGYSN